MARLIRDGVQCVVADAERYATALGFSGRDRDESEGLAPLTDAARAWARDEIDGADIDAAARIPASVLRSARTLGLFGLTVPTDHGGLGLSLKAAGRVLEELAYADAAVAVTVGLHCAQGTQSLVRFGSPELQRRFLPRLATGDAIAAFAATETQAGSDLSAVQTSAVADGAGGLRLRGSKCFVTNGGFADVFTVLARTPDLGRRAGYSLLLVSRDDPGLAVGPEEHKLGLRGSSTVPLHFDDVRLDLDRVIGVPSGGMSHVVPLLAGGRVLVAFGALGGARHAYDLARLHVVGRRQFGRRLGTLGQVRELISGMRATLYAMESVARLAGQVGSEDPLNVGWESAIAKVLCSEGGWWIADAALQLHGGAGFIEDVGMARLLRDARIGRIFEGSNELLRFHVAAAALLFPHTAAPSAPPLATVVAPALRAEAERFDTLNRAIAARLGPLGERLGSGVFERQVPLRPLADALIAVYAMLAVILRKHGELREPAGAESLELARYTVARLAASAEQGLAESDTDDLEASVHAISELEYAQVAP